MKRRSLLHLSGPLLALALLQAVVPAQAEPGAPDSFPPLWASECITCDHIPNGGAYVSLALDAEDYAHVVYDEAGGRFLSAYQDVEGWNFAVIQENCYQASNPFLQLDAQGYEHVIYDCEYHDTIHYAYRNADGWHDQEIFTTEDFVDSGYSALWIYTESLALDSTGRPHGAVRAIIHKGLTDIFYIYLSESSWQAELISDGRHGVVALDADDTVHSAFRSMDGGLYYAYRTDQSWQHQFITNTSAEQMDLVLGSGNMPHIVNSYYDDPVYYWRDADGIWQSDPITTGGVNEKPVLRLDAPGHPTQSFILYQAAASGRNHGLPLYSGTPGKGICVNGFSTGSPNICRAVCCPR